MYYWLGEGVDWKGIGDAADWIHRQLVRKARINVIQSKEKFGTVRVYCSFGWAQLHSITHPSYVYSQYPTWLWNLDCKYLWQVVSLLNPIVVPYQQMVYRRTYKKALRMWPHLVREILTGADYSELLVGLDPRFTRELQPEGYYIVRWNLDGNEK